MILIKLQLIPLIIIVVINFRCASSNFGKIAPAKCVVWGPGLNVFDAPVRYFFIQAIDENDSNFTESVPDETFEVSITTAGAEQARIWVQVLDKHDGSYIVRYRPFLSYDELVIVVTLNGQHVAKSPYVIKGGVYSENCNCPESNLVTWLDYMGCPREGYDQIREDLKSFPKIDMKKTISDVEERFNRPHMYSLCHYLIKDNKVYRKTFGQHVDFKMFTDSLMLSLTRKVRLPDVEFFANLGDWPLEKRSVTENPVPIISWCGSDDTRDIVVPTYDLTEATLNMMYRVTLDMLSVQANTGPKWENKSSVAFWRGRDSRQERLDLVRLSRRRPDLLDARLTNMFFFKHDDSLGEIVPSISFFDFFKYKYQIGVDGTVAAYRFPYLLAGDCLILKQESPYYEHFYRQLQPWVHYVPLRKDLGDLEEKLQWAKDHDEEAKKIALAGQRFANDNLLPKDILCYHVMLFEEYAKRMSSKPAVIEGMELVEQPMDEESKCDCKRVALTKVPSKDEL